MFQLDGFMLSKKERFRLSHNYEYFYLENKGSRVGNNTCQLVLIAGFMVSVVKLMISIILFEHSRLLPWFVFWFG